MAAVKKTPKRPASAQADKFTWKPDDIQVTKPATAAKATPKRAKVKK